MTMGSGLFPHSWDGGIPPNEETPENPPQAQKPGDYTQPVDTSALYYGLGCDVRIRAPVLNSIISEIINVLERAGMPYQAANLNNLVTAIVRLIKSGGEIVPYGPMQTYPGIVSLRGMAADLFVMRADMETLKKEIAALKLANTILANKLKEQVPA